MTPCPVCRSDLKIGISPAGDKSFVNCPRCGDFLLTGTALSTVPSQIQGHPRKMAALSHAIRRAQRSQANPIFDSDVCGRIIEAARIPSPQEQADNLLLWIGDAVSLVSGPGEYHLVTWMDTGIIGAVSDDAVVFIVDSVIAAGLLKSRGGWTTGGIYLTPTFRGWTHYEGLRRGAPSGSRAFMAMKYDDPELESVLETCFRPAVEKTGFYLEPLRQRQKAGLIDDQLRVEIRAARFVLADLTHDNNGAYWEAGYAEGLGKPVIYTCERGHFETRSTHFDTNHHLHVLWRQGELEQAAQTLKAVIRVTIPEARQEDPK